MTLPIAAPIVESDRTFKIRLAFEDSLERDRIEQSYRLDSDPTALLSGDPVQFWTEPTEAPMPAGLIDVELDELPEDPAMGGRCVVIPVISGGSPAAETAESEWDLETVFRPSSADLAEYSAWSEALPAAEDGMALPAKPDSLEDRRRFDRQNRLSEASFARDME